jgi:hypothetical protein
MINELKNPLSRKTNIVLITTQLVEAGIEIEKD